MGGYAVMALGHVLRARNTQWDPEVLKLPVTVRYRKALNADQYRRLLAAVQTARPTSRPTERPDQQLQSLHRQLAQAVGLKVPASSRCPIRSFRR